MQEKLICCCGTSGWTRVIGWFQVIGYTVTLIITISVSALVLVNTDSGRSIRYANGSFRDEKGGLGLGTTPSRGESKSNFSVTIVARIVILTLWFILGLAMSIVLLRGSYNKNPRYLGAWLIYTGICLGLSASASIKQGFTVFVYDSRINAVVILVAGFIYCLIQGFSLWVVDTHKSEINGGTGMKLSALSEAKL